MKKGLWMCALLLSFSCQAESVSGALINQFVGVWQGMGKQDNGTHWSIKVTVSTGFYRIDYPSLNCGGVLEFIKEVGKSVMFKETLTYGTERCISDGTTVLSLETERNALYDWFYPDGRHGAEGNLIRQLRSKKSMK